MRRSELEYDLHDQCKKIIDRYGIYAQRLHEENFRIFKRTGIKSNHTVIKPVYWNLDPSFNPFKVLERKDKILTSLNRSLKSGNYEPFNPIKLEVPKSPIESRMVNVFPIVETTLSTRLYRNLIKKNQVLMSSNSYAYRNDRNAHDAIAKLVRNFHKPGRIFIAEYDFSKFFDNILHDQLFTVAKENGILWTSFEKDLIQKFLQVNPQEIENYNRSQKLSELKTKGIPQGNSISLFLANVAAMNLDLAIEKSGVGYVRYADDTILWSDDYSKLNNGIKALEKQANELGLSVNALKSNGVNLFIKNGEKAEITSVENVNFLGYRFNRSQASIKEETLNRIKKKVENLVYRNLISSLKPNCNLNSNRLAGDFDKDYWTLLFQLRRYIYGGMTDQKINKLLQGKKIRIVFPGVMSYFPLVSDEKQLGDLDAWMFALIRDALVLRKSILLLNGYQLPRQPYDSLNGHLLKPMKVNLSSGKEAEIRIPSFKKIGKLIYETASIYGPNAVSKEALDESYIYGLGSSNF